MDKKFSSLVYNKLNTSVPSTGIGLFRIAYGLVTFLEILFLLYFNHLIFDPVPYIDVEYPMVPFFLCLWGFIAAILTIGYKCQFSAVSNYIFWIIFVNFTPMQRDFDGGFDAFMIGAGFFLLFLPLDHSFSIDNLRKKLSKQIFSSNYQPINKTTILSYQIPVAICLGFLYFDSAIHKLFAEHWRNGLGVWLPLTMPYYISAIDLTWFLNIEILQKAIGYLVLAFQFLFLFIFSKRIFKPIVILTGVCLHLGITISLNIYPFGVGMLIFYLLLIPYSVWERLDQKLHSNAPKISVFYDELCPLCNRTAIIIDHFDLFKTVQFKGLQTYAKTTPRLGDKELDELLTDIYAIDDQNNLFKGIDTYIKIFASMRYTFLIGLFLRTPVIYQIATSFYRRIADNRLRLNCNESCVIKTNDLKISSWHDYFFLSSKSAPSKQLSRRLSKVLVIILLLQINSSLHYGLFYRLNFNYKQNSATKLFNSASNALIMLSHTFLGITPHALYLHDHFDGYEKIFGITYIDSNNNEKWLPFINQQGRMLAPNWGRVHSMWANIAVTPKINKQRFEKFLMKVTAFWGNKIGLNINNTTFIVKQKSIKLSKVWRKDLNRKNLSGEWQNIGQANWNNNQIFIYYNVLPY